MTIKSVLANTIGAMVVIGAVASLGAAPVPPASPNAAKPVASSSASCTAWIEELVAWPLEDRYRVAITCSTIDETTRVRGVADFPGRPDLHTPWFTDTNKTYYSAWGHPLFGITPDARAELAAR